MKNDAVRTQRSAATDRRLSAVTPVRANVTIAGVGAYLPAARLSSDEVQARIADASGLLLPDGIVERITGIATRPLMADDEQCSTLAAAACQDLFARSRGPAGASVSAGHQEGARPGMDPARQRRRAPGLAHQGARR